MQWTTQMTDAIAYIEEHLNERIDYNRVAKIACCTIYNFQRIFSYVFNMSLSEYIRSRKLTLAAIELQSSDSRIIDIALKFGYESHEAFSRAFHKFHGVLPSAVKDQNASYKYCSKAMIDIKVKGGIVMNYVQTGGNHNQNFDNQKLIETVLEVPAEDETCRFASCFTSLYMCMEEPNVKMTDVIKRHNQLYNFFQFISGGVHGTPNSSRKNSYEYVMKYCGYDYIKLGKADGKDKLRYAIVSSINQNMPVLLSLDNTNDNWNIITGYNQNAEVIYGFDGYFSYWKNIENDMNVVKDGYLNNKMYFLRNWFDMVDFIVVIVGKTNPHITNKDVFQQLNDIIKEENAIYKQNIIDIQDDRGENMCENELLILFNDCMGMIYQQMDTRHKLHCTFKESLCPNMPDLSKELYRIADIFIKIHSLGTELFGCLGECWSVFMNSDKYMSEFRKPEVRLKMAGILEQIVDTNNIACVELENMISKL
ncbi:MAG: transcriptional regulator, AraC family [Herbinix sp.]|jgi:AraC-like DNA-binding protein|nr:transcriptional regulator, AraC family [Herbinix sp.]